MNITRSQNEKNNLRDTRAGTDRRQFDYTAYIYERRSGRDRRKGFDRRCPIERIRTLERRYVSSIRKIYKGNIKTIIE
jgi:hypothetical protein